MTREEAIKYMQSWENHMSDNGGVEEAEAFHMAIEALNAKGWIPCSKRLPEKRGIYFVTEQNFGGREEADMHEVVSHSSYYYGNGKWSDRFYSDDVSNITAWMSLPEPWKGADDE